jgi:hypothetical protein
MTTRSSPQEPDPAIRQTIIRARRKSGGDKAMGLVVAASLAATLLGWGVFAHEDAQTAAGQAAQTAQVGATATAPAQPITASVAALPTATALSTPQTSSTTTQSSTTPTQSSTTRTAFTTTQSSR